jgi:hypothetical protein
MIGRELDRVGAMAVERHGDADLLRADQGGEPGERRGDEPRARTRGIAQ